MKKAFILLLIPVTFILSAYGQNGTTTGNVSNTTWSEDNTFTLRTNLLYDIFLMPTLGAEWRIDRNFGAKVDLSFSFWGDKDGKIQRFFMVNPEFRWYQQRVEGLYVGLGFNIGSADIYKGMIGNLIDKNTGYDGSFWNIGIVAGYQIPLSNVFSLDLNIGLGYTRFTYDTFHVPDNTRVYKERDVKKNFVGPTQAGVTLQWHINR